MSIEHEILKIAGEIAERLEATEACLHQEALNFEAKAAAKHAARNLARGARKRLANFEVEFRGYYLCPTCWIEHETRSPMRAIGGGTDTVDFFRCTSCDQRFSVPSRE